jgi:hypothetical protein
VEQLKNAPPVLIKLYQTRSKYTGQFVLGIRRSLLGKLISDRKMKRPWNTIAKLLRADEDYIKLFKAIIEAMRLSRRGIPSLTARRERYERVETYARQLVQLIEVPNRPFHDSSGYRGELDLQAYEFLPQDVANILGAPSWETMNTDQRSQWAYSLLREWPTLVDLLNELAVKAVEKAKEDVPNRRRSRSELGQETEEEISIKTKARLFSCYLDDELLKMNCRLKGTATLRAIASVVYDIDIDSEVLKKALFDHRRKRLLKTR